MERGVELAGEDDSCVTFTLRGEDHTLGNSLRYMLAKRPGVEFVGYSIPHPSEDLMNIRVQTVRTKGGGGESATSAFANSVRSLASLAGIVADAFIEAVDSSAVTADAEPEPSATTAMEQ